MKLFKPAMLQKNLLTKKYMSIITLVMLSGISIISAAHAQPTGYDKISFSVKVGQEIDNDEVQARLYKKAQASSAKALAEELNTAINHALSIAKRYPSVSVNTGRQSTDPRYDENNQIIGWTGEVYLQVKSTDMKAASQLIAELQDSLVIGDIDFGVSEQRKDTIESQLKIRASYAFQEQAKSLANAWGASNYRLLNINLTANGHYQPMAMSRSAAPSMLTSVPAQNFEAGNSRISVTANGSVELVR